MLAYTLIIAIPLEIMWFIYIIRTDNNSLYTGITTNVERRWQEHCHSPKGARFFRTCKPQTLCRVESHLDRSSASKREAAIKKLSRVRKEQLVAEASPYPVPKLTNK